VAKGDAQPQAFAFMRWLPVTYSTTQISFFNNEKSAERDRADRQRIQRYTSDCWFPANPEVLKLIRKNLWEGAYATSQELIDDLKRDFALYTYCLRQLAWAVKNNAKGKDKEGPAKTDILTLFSKLTIADFAKLLPPSPSKISTHRIEAISEVQAQRLQNLVISTTAVETLAKKTELDAEAAVAAALFRQLGLMLVAWNYPRIYARIAGNSTDSERELDARIEQVLGYSPVELGLDLIRPWGIPAEVETAVKLNMASYRPSCTEVQAGDSAKAENEYSELVKLCEIGEALANGSSSEDSPLGRENWEWATREAVAYLGPAAVSLLEEEISQKWSSYSSALPVLFDQVFAADGKRRKAYSDYVRNRYNANPYILKCSHATQQAFLQVYRHMVEGKPSQQSLKILIDELIPGVGFKSGCVYLADQAALKLVPVTAIGEARKEELKPVLYSSLGLVTDALSKAMMYPAPVKGIMLKDARQVLYIAASLGTGSKKGVLYLETDQEIFMTGREDPLVYFKAIRKCLADALNIELFEQGPLSSVGATRFQGDGPR